MTNLTEIRWHGRGGQGTVTAVKMLAVAAQETGKCVQAFPEYGPERMGAPLRAYNRIDDKPIHQHCAVLNPQIVIVVDGPLVYSGGVLDGADDNVIFIANTADSPDIIRKKLNLTTGTVVTVDASNIALEIMGVNRPNTAMLGAIAKSINLLTLEDMLNCVKITFGSKGEKLVKMNDDAIKRAFNEAQIG